jgi:hypothetical protein
MGASARSRLVVSCTLVSVCLAGPAAIAEEIRDWPCEAAYGESFAPEDVWGGPVPAALDGGWRNDATVREVVAYAANPENTPSLGQERIAAFAQTLGDHREQRLMLVFAGLLEEFETLRDIVIGGIRDFVVRAKIINHAIEENEAVLAGLPADGSTEIEQRKQGYQQANFWDERQMDDAMEEAEFLCRRYDYLDRKLRGLTRAIRTAL